MISLFPNSKQYLFPLPVGRAGVGLLIIVTLLSLTGCKSDSDTSVTVTEDTYTVALVLPAQNDLHFDIEGTLALFEKNLQLAQQGRKHKVKLKFERYDEDKENISKLASDLAGRDDIKAVIGPVNQDRLKTMAEKMKYKEDKALMAVNASSTDIVRSSVERGNYFWAFTQTDISKCEIILSAAAKMGARDFDLICANSGSTSQTYKDWFPFETNELGLNLSGNYVYSDTASIRGFVDRCFQTPNLDQKAIVCVPDNEKEAYIMLDELSRKIKELPDEKQPKVFVSDNVLHMSVLNENFDALGIYSVSPSPSPESGFYPGFQVVSGIHKGYLAAQIYDALMLTSMALVHNPDGINQSLIDITSINEQVAIYAWTPENMSVIFEQLEQGTLTSHIAGATGSLVFDKDNHTCVTQSYYMLCYCRWSSLSYVAYYTANEGNHSASAVADWKWQASQTENFDNVVYKPSNTTPLHQRWAVVVAGSEGFENYRHQADALNVYQYLRSVGYDDDHILLIMADDIAQNSSNPKSGQVLGPDGENLYHDVKIDYRLSELTPQQVMDKIAQLPCDEDDNVMVFWSGHGEPGAMKWGDKKITPDMVSNAQDQLKGRYRKMAWFVETCYSGCIGQALYGYDNLIAFTAATSNETSKAYLFNNEVGVWLSNRFSAFMLSKVKAEPKCTIRDLYQYLTLQTIGSHASIFNYSNYGDITVENVKEYF